MESKQLMIGDWVKVPIDYEEPPFQIGSVSVDEVSQSKGAELTFAVSEIEPIPLTPAILEKNGWKIHSGMCLLHNEISQAGLSVWMEWRDSNKTLYIRDALITDPICNVHQLQHAFRVCGLDELADNFKV